MAASSSSSSSSVPEQALVVGIDFGTTYSKVAWAHTGDPDKIMVIENWPFQGNKLSTANERKVKTELAYYQTRTGEKSYKWGAQVGPETKRRLTWFKLLLDDDRHCASRNISKPEASIDVTAGPSLQTETDRMTQGLDYLRYTLSLMPKDKKPVDLVTDYLKGLYKHIQVTLNGTYPQSFMDVNPIHYCLTVPALWSDSAKNMTFEAAKRAGFGDEKNLTMVTEPEAAATCIFRAFKETENCLKVGDVYVIADCGGGTVDLISYEITSLEPLTVVECAMGSGGFCGSTFLDRAFIKLLKQRIGEDEYNTMTEHARWTAETHFTNYLKTVFCASDNEEEGDNELDDIVSCPVPGVPDKGELVQGGFLVLTKEDMKGIFEPVFAQITDLVQKQITEAENRSKKDVTAILLVGGFGSSEYLKKHLEATIKTARGEKINILRPPDALTAIVQGAVHYGMSHKGTPGRGRRPGMVGSRIARFSYGVKVIHQFIPLLHSLRNVTIHPLDGQLYCYGRTSWFIKKGDTIVEDTPIIETFHRRQKTTADMSSYIFPEEIICSDADIPPEHDDDPSVSVLLTYTVDFSQEQRSSFKREKSRFLDGEYYDIEFQMVMRRESALFEFWTERDGNKRGQGTVEYNHEKPQPRKK